MVNFVLLQEDIPSYNKQIIDKGITPQNVYKICSCIRETFCLSYAIRKNNAFYLYFQREYALVKFEGARLRFLGPDERSIALLLEKALIKAKKDYNIKNHKWSKSTPGIFIRKFVDNFSFINFFESIALGKSYLIIKNTQIKEDLEDDLSLNKEIIDFKDSNFFIIPTFTITKGISELIELFKKTKNTKLLSFSKIKDVEDVILYINFKKDQHNNSKNKSKNDPKEHKNLF
ncbi:MAG: hypothetical protein ACFFCE_13305 [Promethearchaeota archaeon]